ncbi:organic hydroperoxide resistance protein [Ferruginibacter paludis]|uniref:organic hydroperoxide resistance protein n=1 Tax=Ferruginibacter paludis TaxID=1310417 RepID=UPI0025B3C323|nr:organic hydroperoxide resistance protein [Ferruginibacter paludis]MDN3656124.1 organic hydroperoxide resistance protein [Ferruginibacter paludis]
MEPLYTATVTAAGGRNGQIKSTNGVLELEVRYPKALGGANDDFTNPEQLFAAGFSACFDNALNKVIHEEKIKARNTSVTAAVSIGKTDAKRYGLTVILTANIPGVTKEVATSLMEKAHQVCAYSNATRGNVNIQLSATTNDY